MAHTCASNPIHCVFSAKGRCPPIPAARTTELHAYLGGIARGEGFSLMAAGGTANHVHLLVALPATCSLAHAVQKLKGSASRWMGDGFSWHEGYGAFSVSPSQVEAVKGYIQNQEEHHRERDFEQELVALLRNCGIAYDERYVFGRSEMALSLRDSSGSEIAADPTLKRGANKQCACGAIAPVSA